MIGRDYGGRAIIEGDIEILRPSGQGEAEEQGSAEGPNAHRANIAFRARFHGGVTPRQRRGEDHRRRRLRCPFRVDPVSTLAVPAAENALESQNGNRKAHIHQIACVVLLKLHDLTGAIFPRKLGALLITASRISIAYDAENRQIAYCSGATSPCAVTGSTAAYSARASSGSKHKKRTVVSSGVRFSEQN